MVQLVGGIKRQRVAQSDSDDWITTTEKGNTSCSGEEGKKEPISFLPERNKSRGELSCKKSSSTGKSTSMPCLYLIAFDCKF